MEATVSHGGGVPPPPAPATNIALSRLVTFADDAVGRPGRSFATKSCRLMHDDRSSALICCGRVGKESN